MYWICNSFSKEKHSKCIDLQSLQEHNTKNQKFDRAYIKIVIIFSILYTIIMI